MATMHQVYPCLVAADGNYRLEDYSMTEMIKCTEKRWEVKRCNDAKYSADSNQELPGESKFLLGPENRVFHKKLIYQHL